MILTRPSILAAIRGGIIRIDPFSEDRVGPASVDLTLGADIRRLVRSDTPIPIASDTDFLRHTEKAPPAPRYAIAPGELVLGITEETITLPDNIAGWLNTRSRFARLGLMVHVTAPFIQPGVTNRQVLEIYNAGPNTLELVPGERLCHIIFETCEGSAAYKGIFQKQSL